jgi:transcription elongation factor Elf1
MNRQRPARRGARLGQRRHPTVFGCLRRWRRRQIRARGNCLWCGHGEDVGATVQKFDIYQGPPYICGLADEYTVMDIHR